MPVVADNLQRRIQIEEELKHVQAQSESVAARLRQGTGWGSDEADKASDLVERTEALTLPVSDAETRATGMRQGTA